MVPGWWAVISWPWSYSSLSIDDEIQIDKSIKKESLNNSDNEDNNFNGLNGSKNSSKHKSNVRESVELMRKEGYAIEAIKAFAKCADVKPYTEFIAVFNALANSFAVISPFITFWI